MRIRRFTRKLVVFNLVVASLVVGSLFTSVAWIGCDGAKNGLSAKTVNDTVTADKEALGAALSMQRAFRNIAKSVGPAVVSVNAVQAIVQRENPYNELFGDDLFRYFFGDRAPQQREQPRQERKKSQAVGSGFVVDKKGYILSNHHVVKQASEITVVFIDGREFKASVVGVDSATDLALLKIEPAGDIPVVALGDSDELEVGDWTIAIGNPFNLPGTFTVGVVSAKSRGDQVGAPYQNFIQTDTAINPGNSGGPLVNIKGEVVGINTMIYTRTGGSLGIGFAIPVNIAKNIVNSLLKTGRFERGYIGIFPGAIDDRMRSALKLPAETGVMINSVLADGPAARAGLKDGDVVLEIAGKKVGNVPQLMRIVAEIPVGTMVPFTIQREWKRLVVMVGVVKRPDDEKIAQNRKPGDPATGEWLGLRVAPLAALSPLQLRQLGVEAGEKGVVITGISADAPESELANGDIVKEINYVAIDSVEAFNRFAAANATGKSFIFKIKRQGRSAYVAVSR